MDEIARAASTAFTLANDLRRDVELNILFTAEPPPHARRIRMLGERLRYLHPDERSTAALLKNALARSVPRENEIESSPGLWVGPVDPLQQLAEFVRHPDSLWLDETGATLRDFRRELTTFSAVVSDDRNLAEGEIECLEEAHVPRVSVGPRSMRTSQCLDLIHGEFDLREASASLASHAL
jgi:tRNA (pseudouridine54-N1)-methyltransferase